MAQRFNITGILLLMLVVCSFGISSLKAQVTETKEKITIPTPPNTSQVFLSGQNKTFRSWQEIEILPETDVQQGAELVFEVLSLETPPSDPDANLNMNWILSRSFNAGSILVGETKKFFDNRGLVIQAQRRNISAGHVLADQTIYDRLGRFTVGTLMAPTMNAAFKYKSDFVTSADGSVYSYTNFDGAKTTAPDAVGNTTPGTLGWYYSNNNTIEPYVPTTGFPYNRSDYYNDGTGDFKRVAGTGDGLRMGTGHEARAYDMPVINELNHYFQVRNKFFPGSEVGASPASLTNGAVQRIMRDANGREGVTISDKDGKVLMTAYPGTGGLSISNSVTLTASSSISSTAPAIHYFKLLAPSVVNISGSYALYDMNNAEGQVSFTSGGNLAAGYYKVVAVSGSVSLSYSNNYVDVSYNFYNQLGQLIGYIAPEGVEKLYGTGLNNYANKSVLPFTALYVYDLRGRLRSSTTLENGKTEYVYRSDGQIRFSQNAKQAALSTKPYSYTNYDANGRPVESGEWTPSASGGIAFNVNGMGIEDNINVDGGLAAGTKNEWTKTVYDVTVANGLAGYTQDDIFLIGKVSQASNSAGAKTWYNYDEQGRVLWTVQELPGVASENKKTIDYTYDALGNVTKMVYQKAVPAETFVHYYEYDADQRLAAVYTNTVDNTSTKVVQAKYSYYLHGPIKRVELGNKVQGLDYTYTAQGWLKAVNHGSRDLDPGKDGISGENGSFAKDAFGMNLEYFSGDYTRSNTGLSSIPLVTTVAEDQYTGNIKGISWHSRKPQSVIASLGAAIENPTMYGFKYDSKYQLNAGTWGTPNYSTPGFTASSSFKEYNLAYDANGNIQTLARTGEAGTVTDNFTYNYLPNTNKLQSVSNGSSTYASYVHNEVGQLTTETPGAGQSRFLKYDATGKVIGVYADATYSQPKVTFVYNERGQRIAKKDWINNLTTHYVRDLKGQLVSAYIQTGSGTLSQSELPVYAANRIGLYRRSGGLYEYELSDHLGTVRAVIDQNRNIKQYADYYPFGYELRRGGSTDYRYGFQGQFSEKDGETGWNAFDTRMYDSRIARWLSVDPKRQYNSPYVGMGNNPLNGVDPDGAEFERLRAQLYAFWHGGIVNKLSNGWSVVRGGEDGSAIAKVFYYDEPRPWKFVFQTSATLTAGAQMGVELGINQILKVKGDINLGSVEMISVEENLADLKDKKTLRFIGDTKEGTKWKHAIGVELESGELSVGPSIEYTYSTHEGYHGPILIKGSEELKVQWASSGTEAILIKPAVLVSSTKPTEQGKTFKGFDFSAAASFLLGVDVNIKIGAER
jgi:RHS repeat-associated protein